METVTLNQIYKLSNYTLFSNIVLPESLDKQLLIDSLLDECGEYDTISFDASIMKQKTERFFRRYKLEFEKVMEALNKEYNPIENYDRYETISDAGSNENKTASYDSEDYANSNKQLIDNNRVAHLHGNIGVTQTQDMIRNEMRLRATANIYDYITDKFTFELCVPVLGGF